MGSEWNLKQVFAYIVHHLLAGGKGLSHLSLPLLPAAAYCRLPGLLGLLGKVLSHLGESGPRR